MIGYFIGVLPGAGATIASFLAYAVEKKVSKTPERFGKGAIEAVAAQKWANNAAATGAMVPMFALGIPGSGTTAIMLGALIMFGLQPGPAAVRARTPISSGTVIASMYVGNVMLLILNLPLVGPVRQLLRVPYAHSSRSSSRLHRRRVQPGQQHERSVAGGGFGVVGYLMKKYDFPAAPLGARAGARAACSKWRCASR